MLPVRVLFNAAKFNLLRGNREQLMLAFLECAVKRASLFCLTTHVVVHRFLSYAPTCEVKPTVSLHRELYSALMANRRAEVCLVVGEGHPRSEEHTSELQSRSRISYAVFCLKKKKK